VGRFGVSAPKGLQGCQMSKYITVLKDKITLSQHFDDETKRNKFTLTSNLIEKSGLIEPGSEFTYLEFRFRFRLGWLSFKLII
jgi:hypothetical protein